MPVLNPTLNPQSRSGLSVIEIMIALVMTLIVLGAMMAAFSYGSAEMQKGRSAIELNNRLITAEEQLRRDLDRITVELKPHHDLPSLPKGYVEIVDGPQQDYNLVNEVDAANPYLHGGNELVFGDRDDYFACTIRSPGRAFRGRRNFGGANDVIESHFAEVAWFTIETPGEVSLPNSASNQMVVRRQLLILPSLGTILNSPNAAAVSAFFAQNDISARLDPVTGNLVANSLEDLAVRGNRYGHINPGASNPAASVLQFSLLPVRSNANHIMFTSAASFDVQVFAPDASVNVVPNSDGSDIFDIAEPSDIGTRKSAIGISRPLGGAYVDLGKGSGLLGGPMRSSVNCNYAAGGQVLFDTGTSEYNRNQSTDNGADGIDDLGVGIDGVVDDWQERDSIAPYDTPLRGLRFTMRVIEPTTKQVRQISVAKSFVTN